jgi:[ribosomal protein S5]-alanine N-acetyltransferase
VPGEVPAADGDAILPAAFTPAQYFDNYPAINVSAGCKDLHERLDYRRRVITTERLTLLPFTLESAAATATAALDGTGPRDPAWADGFPREDDQDAAGMYSQAHDDVFGSWFIVARPTGQVIGQVIGTIGFFGPPDDEGVLMVGYGLVEQARRHGYATEALQALMGYAFDQPGVVRVVADPDLDNVPSHRVLEKAGFRPTHSTQTSQWFALDVASRG